MINFDQISLKTPERILFSNASLDVAPGDKVVVRGASGGGKSSLLKAAVGAFPLAAGSARVDGLTLSAQTIAAIRARVAFIGQEPVLGADTIEASLLLPFTFKAHEHQRPEMERVVATIERLRLPASILERSSEHVSGGEKQRVVIARALLLDKNIFLADEATSALDPDSREAVMDALFRPDLTLLSVSHDPVWVERCDRVVAIERGELAEEASP